ncbi:MAG TPA: transferrin receptor-like dimerization domain-containing protein [Rhizomicrobium sp.]|nr:transferrin receptor-like dimerization domain-containing protein [Rhizomicrobium sp.]
MRRIALLAATSLVAAAISAAAATSTDSLERRFDAAIDPAEMSSWMRLMAAEPNNVGTAHDRQNAQWELQKFKEFGWDAHIETFQALYPTPVKESLELLGPKPYRVRLDEPPIKGDSSATAKHKGLPAYLVYQGDGDVTAPLVYVNYGMRDDYKTLERLGVSVKGKIVIARYGAGWRGLKPRLAADHGALGCIIYSDPSDDGYSVESVYPKGPARPPEGIQRGSVADMTLYPGDPLTPGVAATADAKRLAIKDSPAVLHIPAIPISYADAKVLLSTLDGRTVPESWRGRLPITYRVGPSAAKVHLMVKSDWSLKPVYDVVAMLSGSTWPDQWVLRGNHHDGWVFGADDPLSGQVALLEEAKALGELVKTGWRPKRTIVYLSWDGEEPGLLGSTEWAEAHAAELKQKAVLYINSDSNGRGALEVEGSHDLQHFVNQVAAAVDDPETHVSVGERLRAFIRVEAATGGGGDAEAKARLKEDAKLAADPTKDFPIGALGSGSDYSAFIEHLGLDALNIGYGGEGSSGGIYHSRYDTFEHYERFGDPGFAYEGALAKTVGRLVMRAADSDLPIQQAGDFAGTMESYLNELKKLEKDKREAAEIQDKMLADRSYQLAADPTKTSGVPTALKAVPTIDLAPLEAAVTRLKASAKAYDDALAANGASLSSDAAERLRDLMLTIDQTLTMDVGLPERPWYRNLVYAPGRFTGYGAKTLPGVREAIEDERFADADKYSKLTAQALNAYSDRLDRATAVLTGK